jgi:hypothetical protein
MRFQLSFVAVLAIILIHEDHRIIVRHVDFPRNRRCCGKGSADIVVNDAGAAAPRA